VSGPATNPTAALGATPQPSVIPATGKCVVSYAVWSDTGPRAGAPGQFKAQVTLANRDDTPVSNWKLWFLMPGDQTLSGRGQGHRTQAGPAIPVSSGAALQGQGTLTVPIGGRYLESNTPPLAFMLNGRTCETFVSAKPGEPAKQVVNLSNGQKKLVAP